MREHEQDAVRKTLGPAARDLIFLDALKAPFNFTAAKDASAVILGGSGRFFVSRGDPQVQEAVLYALNELRLRHIPLLGICFGAHLLTEAFGGQVEHWPEKAETGSFLVEKLEAADHDPLFSALPSKFWAQLGHKDFITRLPTGAANLAKSERADSEAWCLAGENIYALQFHPELDQNSLTERALHYLDEYIGPDKSAFEKMIAEARPSREASSLLPRFVELAREKGRLT